MSLLEGSSFCLSDSLLTVDALPSEGEWFFDGASWNTFPIDLATLSPGSHTLEYVKTHAYPWIDQLDANYTLPAMNWTINSNSTLWQSFKPQSAGYIDYFGLGLYSNNATPVSYALRSGTGLSGNLLYSGSRTFGGESTYMQYFDFPDFSLLLHPDSTYTFLVSFTNPNGSFAIAGYQNNYPDGTSSYTIPNLEVDLHFELHTNPLYACSSDTASATFEVVDQFVVDLGPDQAISGNQTITLDAGNAGNSYLWSSGETTQQIEVVASNSGIIWVEVYNENGCSSSDTVEIQLVTEQNTIAQNILRLQPNPADAFVQLIGDETLRSVSIYDLSGRIIYTQTGLDSKEKSYVIHTAAFPKGMYFVRVETKGASAWLPLVKH
jgi:hypothetical protein